MFHNELLEAAEKAYELRGNGVPLAHVLLERARQERKWGTQNHQPVWYLAILMEEVGELAQSIIETNFGHGENQGAEKIYNEATQVAAVALAMVECLDRNLALDKDWIVRGAAESACE